MNQAMMMKIRKMQKELEQTQARLKDSVFEGTAAGLVTVELKGTHELLSVKINQDAWESFEDLDDLETLQDSIVSAYNDALNKLNKEEEKSLAPFAGLGLF